MQWFQPRSTRAHLDRQGVSPINPSFQRPCQTTGLNCTWNNPGCKVHGANMGPTWVLSAPDGPHVGPMNLAITERRLKSSNLWFHFLSRCLTRRICSMNRTRWRRRPTNRRTGHGWGGGWEAGGQKLDEAGAEEGENSNTVRTGRGDRREIWHYSAVIMGAMASEITSLTIVYSAVYSGADHQRKHQSSASLAFVRRIHGSPVNFPHKWSVKRKMFHLMTSSCHGRS